MKNFLNIEINGHLYIEGFLGLTLLKSADAVYKDKRYEDAVEHLLKNFLWGKFTSSQVLKAISRKSSKKVVIVPFSVPKLTPADENLMRNYSSLKGAEKEKADRLFKNYIGETMAIPKNSEQTFVLGLEYKRPDSQGYLHPVHVSETRKGSDVTIQFNPGIFADVGGPIYARTGFTSDEVLLHELIHAMGCVEATAANLLRFQHPLENYMRDSFDDLDEFKAIVITNVYRSELGRKGLRGSHNPDHFVDLNASGQEFYNFFQKDMEQICKIHPLLARELKRAVNIPFNPFIFCQV